MKSSVFFALILTSSILFSALIWLFRDGFLATYYPSLLILAVAIGALSTIVSYLVVARGLERDPKKFLNYLFTGMLAKMGLGLLSVAVVALSFKDGISSYVVGYFIIYLIFTIFEVSALMYNLRANPKQKT
ncbi:MAG: hypothetical protein AAGI38_00160 [Bacteroidota bacterium]